MTRLLLSFAVALTAPAADWGALKPEGYVSDFARVMEGGSRTAINQYLAAVEKSTGAQVAIVTIDSLDGEPVEDVAHKLFESFGVGKKSTNEGALFLLAIRDRRSRLEIGYGLEPIVPDGAAGEILRAMRPALRAGEYGPALVEAARLLGERIARGKGVRIEETLPAQRFRREDTRGVQDNMWVRILVLILFLYLMSKFGGGGRRRYYGGVPGGWGGAARGGASWGGFGGGRSGGGGASSSW